LAFKTEELFNDDLGPLEYSLPSRYENNRLNSFVFEHCVFDTPQNPFSRMHFGLQDSVYDKDILEILKNTSEKELLKNPKEEAEFNLGIRMGSHDLDPETDEE